MSDNEANEDEDVESDASIHHLTAPSGGPAEGTVGPLEDGDQDEEVECDDPED